jgi:hypothetical protein
MFDDAGLVLIGSPKKLIDRIRWLQEFYDPTYLLFEVGQGGLSPDKVVTSLERFARDVMPAFAE